MGVGGVVHYEVCTYLKGVKGWCWLFSVVKKKKMVLRGSGWVWTVESRVAL